ncbi:hypothetical protein Nepgr_022889 [Nepenthes gracilis]|uniref:Secreted protein n=1 Tax=Nepenthes gracilis TaxID=150966 RepID=A0AAD3T2W2_NEPGR|nr:hypothetical protein Nepgr_022889 [Nepenthes gracilis]
MFWHLVTVLWAMLMPNVCCEPERLCCFNSCRLFCNSLVIRVGLPCSADSGLGIVDCVDAQCYAVSLKGSAARLHLNSCEGLLRICLVVNVGSLCSAISFLLCAKLIAGGSRRVPPTRRMGLPLCVCRIGCLPMLPRLALAGLFVRHICFSVANNFHIAVCGPLVAYFAEFK